MSLVVWVLKLEWLCVDRWGGLCYTHEYLFDTCHSRCLPANRVTQILDGSPIENIFAKMDGDSNGSLTAEEIQTFFGDMVAEGKKGMHEKDVNGDGSLDLDEFKGKQYNTECQTCAGVTHLNLFLCVYPFFFVFMCVCVCVCE